MQILAVISAIQGLIGIIDELEKRGAKLTPDMRARRAEHREVLNSLWEAHLAQHREENPGVADPEKPF
jgi:hypothetical protein